jgi:redox-sensitive bicupin YhaK (pirin superfamily)
MKVVHHVAYGMCYTERHRKNRGGRQVHYVEMWCPATTKLKAIPPVLQAAPDPDLPTMVAPEMTINTRMRFEARTISEMILPRR